jgi:hypothetical protein
VAGAQPWHPAGLDESAQPVTLFTLSFSPATRRAAMARLPAPPVPGTDLTAAALSPDGSKVAEVTLTPARPVRERYLANPLDTPDMTQWQAEVCWPPAPAGAQAN